VRRRGPRLRIPRFARQCAAVARRDLALQRTYGLSALLGMLSAALGLVAYHYIGRLVGDAASARLAGGSYFAFVFAGVTLQMLVAASLGALGGALARGAAEGTLEPELACGASPLALVLGAAGAPVALALLQVACHTAVCAALFGLPLGDARVAPAAVAALATLAACAPLGIAGAAAWLLFRRPGVVTTAALFAFAVVGGIYFPVELLPAPLARLAGFVPLAVGLDAVRAALLGGAGFAETSGALLRLALLCALAWPPALLLFRGAWSRALRRGTLALV
jgi:ABC-2 type transport system permease protein